VKVRCVLSVAKFPETIPTHSRTFVSEKFGEGRVRKFRGKRKVNDGAAAAVDENSGVFRISGRRGDAP